MIEIDFTKSAQDNADEYYKKSKKLLAKKAGAEKAVVELKRRLEKAEKGNVPLEDNRKIVKISEKEWFEKFNWFYTSDGLLVIAGRDAHQNEMLNSKHFDDNDLFFHANIFGAPVTILKNGAGSGIEIRQEVRFDALFEADKKRRVFCIKGYPDNFRSVELNGRRSSELLAFFNSNIERYTDEGLVRVFSLDDDINDSALDYMEVPGSSTSSKVSPQFTFKRRIIEEIKNSLRLDVVAQELGNVN